MKSIRDLVRKMPETRRGLEQTVLKYSPAISEAVERDPKNRALLDESVNDSFGKYEKYLRGLTQKLSAAGHAVGYTADAWLATGDIVGSLGGNFIDLLAQIPQKAYSVVYAVETGNYIDSLQNIFEGLISYLPGFTVADQGLSRIVQKRMVKDVIYAMEDKLGIEHTPWYRRSAEKAKEAGYTGVRDRSDNVIRVDFRDKGKERLRRAA